MPPEAPATTALTIFVELCESKGVLGEGGVVEGRSRSGEEEEQLKHQSLSSGDEGIKGRQKFCLCVGYTTVKRKELPDHETLLLAVVEWGKGLRHAHGPIAG